MPTRICQCLLRTEWRKESREKNEKRRLEECRQCAVEKSQNSAVKKK